MGTTVAQACPMTSPFAPRDDQQRQLVRITVPPSQPCTPYPCSQPQCNTPVVSPCWDHPHASHPSPQHPITTGCQSSLTTQAQHSRSCLPVSRTSPSQLAYLPMHNLAPLPIRHRHHQQHGGFGSLRDIQSTNPRALLVSFVTAEIRSNMCRELHARLALFSPAVAISGLSCSQTG